MIDENAYVCERCPPAPAERLDDAVAACARCLQHDGTTIDRAHTERLLAAFGAIAEPLEPRLAERARAARPELPRDGLLVAPLGATLVHPAENYRARLAALVRLDAPEVILESTRQELAEAEAREVRLEWERVDPWPAPARYPGTIAFGTIAETMAAHALPPLVGDAEAAPLVDAIRAAAAALVLDDAARAQRDALAARVATARPSRVARGLELAVRLLDELGHTDLRDNQDTLVDDCYFALEHQGLATAAAATYRTWLTVAVPRAVAAVAAVSASSRG